MDSSENSDINDDMGIELTQDIISEGTGKFDFSLNTRQHVFSELNISDRNLNSIDCLKECVYLKKVNISNNKITDISCFGNSRELVSLNASNNKISKLFPSSGRSQLLDLDLSHNEISELSGITPHKVLESLIMSYNKIETIEGMEKCRNLENLNLSHNSITKIQNLDGLHLKELDLSFNSLSRIENLQTLRLIEKIYLSNNKINSLCGLENNERLEYIDASDNEIIDMSEIEHMKGLKLLTDVFLRGNPLHELPHFYYTTIYCLPKLTHLDGLLIEIKDRVRARNMLNPSMEVVASMDHIMHVVHSFLQPSYLRSSTLASSETPYPMLVLVGPEGSGKKDLAMRLAVEFSDYFGYCRPVTTNMSCNIEVENQEYEYASKDNFEDDFRSGRFLLTYGNDDIYGIALDSIENIAHDGLASILQLELDGALSLKKTYFIPRYVLIFPHSELAHKERLNKRQCYDDDKVNSILKDSNIYAEYNQKHPGFFDMVVNSDDIKDAYRNLQYLVMSYLGLIKQSSSNVSFNLSSNRNSHEPDIENRSNKIRPKLSNSRHSTLENLCNAFSGIGQMRMSPQIDTARGVVEEESLKRRKSAAKNAATEINFGFDNCVGNTTSRSSQMPHWSYSNVHSSDVSNYSPDTKGIKSEIEAPIMQTNYDESFRNNDSQQMLQSNESYEDVHSSEHSSVAKSNYEQLVM